MNLLKLPLLICFYCWVGSQSALACKYNVRDVGFVDLEDEPYGLICYIDDSCEDEMLEKYTEFTTENLAGTNVRPLIFNVDREPDELLLSFLGDRDTELPAFVLVSADMGTIQVESIVTGADFESSLGTAIEGIINSPVRRAIAEKVIDIYGMVLILEGTDSEANEQAVEQAQAAIKYIDSQMEWMPKAAGKSPVMMTVSIEEQAQEEIFLWSMGADRNNITQPQALVIYGRGRLMRKVLSGDELTEVTMANLLSVIGADCECGLDRSWMQGNMMPFKWDNDLSERMYDSLGFDTEHPMIKFEISRILRRGQQSYSEKINMNMIDEYDLGYKKSEVETETTEIITETAETVNEMVPSPAVTSQEMSQGQKNDNQTHANEDEFKLWDPLYMIAGVGVVAAGVCLMVLMTRKKQ